MLNWADSLNNPDSNSTSHFEAANERHVYLPAIIEISSKPRLEEGWVPIIETNPSGFCFRIKADEVGFLQLFGFNLSENRVLTSLLPPDEFTKFENIIKTDLTDPFLFQKANYRHFRMFTPDGILKHVVTSTRILKRNQALDGSWEMTLEMVFFDATEAIEPLIGKQDSKTASLLESFIRDLRTKFSISSVIINQITSILGKLSNTLKETSDINQIQKLTEQIETLSSLNLSAINNQQKIESSLSFLQSLLNSSEKLASFSPGIWIETFKTRASTTPFVRVISIDETLSQKQVFGNESLLDLSVKVIINKIFENQAEGFNLEISIERTDDAMLIKLNKSDAKIIHPHLSHLAAYWQNDSFLDQDQIESVDAIYVKKIIKEYFGGSIDLTITHSVEDLASLECIISLPFRMESSEV